MKIIKRNGAEVPFDITKIITAVTKASDSVGGKSRLTREQITQIASERRSQAGERQQEPHREQCPARLHGR